MEEILYLDVSSTNRLYNSSTISQVVWELVDDTWVSMASKQLSRYEICRSGKIRQAWGAKLVKKPYFKGNTSCLIYLRTDDNYDKKPSLASLVASFFLPIPQEDMILNHKDDDYSNCNADNLEWITKLEAKLRKLDGDFIRDISLIQLQYPEYEWRSLSIIGVSRYAISHNGMVYSNFHHTKDIIGGFVLHGYHLVHLTHDNGQRRKWLIHQLVVYAFLGPPPGEGYTVDHIDRNRFNNDFRNLQWATSSEQALNRKGGHREGRAVVQLMEDDETVVKIWPRLTDAAREIHVNNNSLREACKNGILLKGFCWMYADQEEVPGEIWQSVETEVGSLLVSSMGRVKLRKSEWITKGSKGNDGYRFVTIKGKTFRVHILIARAFKGEISDGLVVDHINTDKADNRLENLDVVTQAENVQRAINRGCIKTRPVLQFDFVTGMFLARYSSARSAREVTGVNRASIGDVCRGRRFSAGGYKWEYEENHEQPSPIHSFVVID
jgi:hypothetical protein